MQQSKTLLVNRIDKKELAHRPLLLSITVSTPYIIFINILSNPSYAKEIKFYDETGKYQASNASNDDTNPDTKYSGKCDRIAINSGECDAFTSMISSLESIKCS
jgi:hypothetical protein